MAKTPTPKTATKKHLARLEKERNQTRLLLGGVIAVFVLIVGVIIYGILDQKYFQANRVVAQVGDTKITAGQFQAEVRFRRFLAIRQYEQYAGNPILAQFYASQIQQMEADLNNPTTIGQSTLDDMITSAIIEQEAKARKIEVTDEELEAALQEAFGYYAKGTPTFAPTSTPFVTATLDATQLAWVPPTRTPTPEPTLDPLTPTATATTLPPTATATPSQPTPTPTGPTPTPTLTETPFPTPTPYTLEGFKTTMADFLASAQSVGYTEAQLRAYVRRGLLREKVYKALTDDLPKEEEKIWARHILVNTEDEARQVLQRLNSGESFVKVASEVSLDTSNKDIGGDLGWFGKGVMDVDFETAAYALKVGEVSQPVKSQFGYHIIQLLGRQVLPLTDDELTTKKQNAYNDWLTKAKEDLKAQTFDLWQTVVPTDPVLTPIALPSGG